MDSKILRDHLVKSLKGGQAFVPVEEAITGIDHNIAHKILGKQFHSIFQEVEHLRIAQEDILKYMIQSDWKSPKWPDAYWVENPEDITKEMLEKSVTAFLADLDDVIHLVRDEEIDLTSPIPHAKEHTYLREVLLIIEHNAYHLGKIIDLRKLYHNWK